MVIKTIGGDLMKYDPSKYKSMIDFMRHVSNQTAIANNKIINLNQTKYPDTQINGMLIIV